MIYGGKNEQSDGFFSLVIGTPHILTFDKQKFCDRKLSMHRESEISSIVAIHRFQFSSNNENQQKSIKRQKKIKNRKLLRIF